MSPDRDRKFEERLRTMQPVEPDPRLAGRIQAALASAARRRRLERIRSASIWSAMALAASVLITFGVLLFNGRLAIPGDSAGEPLPSVVQPAAKPASAQAAGNFRPVLAENNLQNRVDEGIVFLRNGLTARRYRYEFVDRVVWQNPADGAVVEVEIPREEVVLVPVKTY